MKKILRLVTTSVLTLTLVACGEAASSSVNTGGTTTTGTGTVSSAYANVTSVTLSAASNTLTQVAGALQRVSVTAALNANTNPTLTLEWFVDGVKSSQTGRNFEFTPNKGGTFAIQARVGSVSSNVLNVVVGQAAITSAAFVDANTIEVVAPGGATVTVAGQTVADTSFYDLKNGKYVIDLEDDLIQGTEVTVSLARDGFQPLTQKVTFDTRTFKLDELVLFSPNNATGEKLVAVNGVYKIVRPFDSGALYNKTYEVQFETTNILVKGTTKDYKVVSSVPAGATSIPSSSELVPVPGNKSFNITSETALGLYTHNFDFDGKVVEVKVEVVNPVKEIVLQTREQWDSEVGANVEYEVRYGKDNDTDAILSFVSSGYVPLPVEQAADGSYLITKPFDTKTGFYAFEFVFIARNFEKTDFINNQFTVSLVGPTTFSTMPTPLFSGMNMKDTGNRNSTVLTSLSYQTFAGQVSVTGGRADTSASASVYQFVDTGTPVGDYVFTIAAGTAGKEITKEVKVRVQEPKPSLDFFMLNYTSVDSGVTRQLLVNKVADNSYEIEKPMNADSTFKLGWISVLTNYQSKLLTANDFAEVTNDTLRANNDDKELFNSTTGIQTTAKAFPDAELLVRRGITIANPQVVRALVRVTDGPKDVSISSANGSGGFVKLTAGSTVTALATGDHLITLGTIETETATTSAAVGDKGAFTITNATLVNSLSSNVTVFEVQISDFPDAIELGVSSTNLTDTTQYFRFVDVSLDVNGPSTLIPSFSKARAAIILAAGHDGLVLFNQASDSDALDGGGIDTTFNDAKLRALTDNLNYEVDAGAEAYDTNDIPGDDLGLLRRQIQITNTTVEGMYVLTFKADDLVTTINLRVKNPTPKVFVMSGLDATKLLDEDFLPVDGNLGATEFSTEYNLIKFYDEAGTISDAVNALDKFVYPVNGVYTVELPATTRNDRESLYGSIKVADLAKGTYTYSITKKYPDGREERFSDSVKVGDLDDNQVANFDLLSTDAMYAANEVFKSNWKLEVTKYELGTYEYSFTIGSATRNITINVVEPPSFKVNKLTVDGVELMLFNKEYRALVASPVNEAIGDIFVDVELQNITEAEYYYVYVSAANPDGNVGAWVLADITTTANPADTALKSLEGVKNLYLGEIISDSLVNEKLVISIKFYKTVQKVNVGDSGFALIGTQTLTITGDN